MGGLGAVRTGKESRVKDGFEKDCEALAGRIYDGSEFKYVQGNGMSWQIALILQAKKFLMTICLNCAHLNRCSNERDRCGTARGQPNSKRKDGVPCVNCLPGMLNCLYRNARLRAAASLEKTCSIERRLRDALESLKGRVAGFKRTPRNLLKRGKSLCSVQKLSSARASVQRVEEAIQEHERVSRASGKQDYINN
ncbi:hypothetical protein NC652_024315 [Populus alba x Populus x berolinensis]|nr:hypothetical protein NC652_024315 [Populus alba x Populus x berolinensis]